MIAGAPRWQGYTRLTGYRDGNIAVDARINCRHAVMHQCRGFGFQNALRAQRAVTRAERELAGVGMRARRMTLQIQYELDTAQRERDAAMRREQEAAEQRGQLAELNQALQVADRAKTRFLAAASHDLRQPIHALGLQLAQLVRLTKAEPTTPEAPVHAVADRMGRALGSLTSMFDTLLDISRMDSGAIAPQPRAVGLRALLSRLAEEFLPVAQANGLRLVLRVPAHAATRSDPALLESVVRNLLSNAIKYTRRGGVVLAVRPRLSGWALQVWDTGPGIPVQEQERIFEEFYRLPGDGRDHSAALTPGLGLGLAIVHRLSRLLDHGLELRSVPGRGSRFSLQLACAALPALAEAEAPVGLPAMTTRPLHLALIEDDQAMREGLSSLLRHWGHVVVDGVDADAVFAAMAQADAAGHTTQLDAVIADYRLLGPATGDVEIERLRQGGHARAASLIITGESEPERLHALSASGIPWLAKPLQHGRLRSWLGSVASAEPVPVVDTGPASRQG